MANFFSQETFVGNIGSIYELRYVGKDNNAVIDFTVASTPRMLKDGEWVDGPTVWHSCNAWGRIAENIAQSFKKGDRVIIHGDQKMRSGYTNKDGVEVPAKLMINVLFAGLEVTYNPATSSRSGGSSSSQNAASTKSKGPAKTSKPAPKAEPVVDDFDLDDDLDLDDDEPAF